MAGKDTSFTLAHWRIAIGEISVAMIKQITPAMEHVRADWAGRAVGAPAHQLAFGSQVIARSHAHGQRGREIFDKYYGGLAGVSQGQAAAGGIDRVAERKEYNTRQG